MNDPSLQFQYFCKKWEFSPWFHTFTVSVVVYGLSLRIASLLYVSDQYHFHIGRRDTHMELAVFWFLFLNLLNVSFPLHETWTLIFFSRETYFLHVTCYVLIFVNGTLCVLIFVRETLYMLIFLFLKLLLWFFSSWNYFPSWNLLRADFFRETYKLIFFIVKLILFMELGVWDFCLWNVLLVDSSLSETCTFVSGISCVLIFVHETCCMLVFLFVKLVKWFSSS